MAIIPYLRSLLNLQDLDMRYLFYFPLKLNKMNYPELFMSVELVVTQLTSGRFLCFSCRNGDPFLEI